MTFDNTNRGALFKNKHHERDTDADYRGSVNIDGTEYWLSAWLKTSKAGEKYLSLSVLPKQNIPKVRAYDQRRDDLNDEIGF